MKNEMKQELIAELEKIDIRDYQDGINQIEVYLPCGISYDIAFELNVKGTPSIGAMYNGQAEYILDDVKFKAEILDVNKFDQDGDILEVLEREFMLINDTLNA